jgi:neopullulanase
MPPGLADAIDRVGWCTIAQKGIVMTHRWRTAIVGLVIAGCCATLLAQLSANCVSESASSAAPCVYQVDPPNWWTAMPAPMLLLYGRNLKGAQISAHGAGVRVTRTQLSENGHYAFVWLSNEGSAAQTVTVHVVTPRGTLTFPYELEKRKPETIGFQGFSAKDSLYLIMTDRFADGDLSNDGPAATSASSSSDAAAERARQRGWHGGDFKGIEDHLDYLKQLGITCIWITPAYDNSGGRDSYHGYGATNMYGTDPHFGTVKDFQHLVDATHARGMKFVLDTVPNHVGANHPWATDQPAPDWFHGTVAHHDKAQSDFSPLVDPHADWQQQKDVTEGWFANVLPDMNQENPLVSQYLTQNAIWWIETGRLDALRIDTFPYVGRAFWQSFNAEIHDLFPRVTSVGEVFNGDPTITSFFAGGVARGGIDTGLWTPFDFPSFFALRAVLSHKEPMSHLEDIWRDDRLYPHPERLAPFIGNHDTPRFLNMEGVTTADLKLAFGILLTMRGMPQIYSGDEIAMRGGADPDNRHDFPGGFPGDTQSAFSAAGRSPEQNEMHDWVAGLLNFRNANPVFADGEQQDLVHDASALVFLRALDLKAVCNGGDSHRVLVAVNDASEAATLNVDTAETALAGCTAFAPAAGTDVPATLEAGKLTIKLGPKQMAIYEVR